MQRGADSRVGRGRTESEFPGFHGVGDDLNFPGWGMGQGFTLLVNEGPERR